MNCGSVEAMTTKARALRAGRWAGRVDVEDGAVISPAMLRRGRTVAMGSLHTDDIVAGLEDK